MNILTPIEKLQAQIAQSQQTLDKLTVQDEKLDSNLKQLRQAMEKKLQKQGTNPKASSTAIDQDKIEKQLEKELQNARNKLKQYHNELKAQARRMSNKSNTNSLEQLFSLEQSVKQKDAIIKQLHEEIKELNNTKRKQEKILEMREKKNQDQSGGKVAKLAEEISGLKELLSTLQQTHAKKKEGLAKKHKQIQELEDKYKAVCAKNNQEPITFEQFKEQRRERKNLVQDSPSKKKQHMSIKEIISAKDNYDSLQPTLQNLQKLKEKREIAQNALKNAKRKHEKEIDQLTKKLEFLTEENGILQGRLKEKQKQKQIVETRFVQTKKTAIRKLTPLK